MDDLGESTQRESDASGQEEKTHREIRAWLGEEKEPKERMKHG